MNPIEAGEAVRSRLAAADVPAFEHPAASLPVDEGRTLPAAVVSLHTERPGYRASGRRSPGVQTATVHCVGSTAAEALWVATRVRDALDGFRLTPTSGTAREDSYAASEPDVNPDANPVRVEVPLIFHFPI